MNLKISSSILIDKYIILVKSYSHGAVFKYSFWLIFNADRLRVWFDASCIVNINRKMVPLLLVIEK